MKQTFLVLLACIIIQGSFCQSSSKSNTPGFAKMEDSLKTYAAKIIQSASSKERFTSDSIFTRIFVRALKMNNSFQYPFDSLLTISKLYPPDSSFRIFTWQLVISENLTRQHGAIQMRTYDGTLKLFPLIDKSDVTVAQTDTVGNHLGWIGAVYYKLIQNRSMNQNYYTLLGFDENNIKSSRKIIEVLRFANDEPQFGGRYFSFENDKEFKSSQSRYILEFKKDAGTRLAYDVNMDMIVFEHLQSETNEPQKKWTMIPDGDYEGFKWQNGKWIHVEKVFNQVTPEGQEPVPAPIKDDKGNTTEEKLQNNEEKAPVENMPNSKKVVKP